MVCRHHTVGDVSAFSVYFQRAPITFDFRFLHGMHANEALRRFGAFFSRGTLKPLIEMASHLGRKGRKGMFDAYR